MSDNMPVIRISLQVGLGESRALSFETYLAADADTKLISAVLDKLNFCADRQKAKYEVEDMERTLVSGNNNLRAMEDNLKMLDGDVDNRLAMNGKMGKKQPTEQEKKARLQIAHNIKDHKEKLDILAKDIAKKRALIGDPNGNSASAANN